MWHKYWEKNVTTQIVTNIFMIITNCDKNMLWEKCVMKKNVIKKFLWQKLWQKYLWITLHI